MFGTPYEYASEKFNQARSILMLPHQQGEAASIHEAYWRCEHGLGDVKPEHLDDDAAEWVRRLRELMDVTGIEDSTGRGTGPIRAAQLSMDERMELSHIVDELAHYFTRRKYDEIMVAASRRAR